MTEPATKEAGASKKGPSQATLIARLAVNLGVELFHDSERNTYATVSAGETYPIRAKAFQQWLARAYYNDARAAASASTLSDAINLLAASADHSGPEHEVHVRIAYRDGDIWVDLGKRAVRVTPDGWTIEDDVPVRFLRPRGMLPLPEPVPTPADQLPVLLAQLTNVRAEDLMMVTAWMVGVMRGRSPFPILILTGDHGTAKSFGSQTIRSIIDPNIAPLRSTPREPRDLMIAARNSYIAAFDNLSTIPDWFSDDLCRLATGSGFATRELHTDADEVIFRSARPILFNSITDVARRPDLLDRSMVVALDPIPAENRLLERELLDAFRIAHPAILGALLDGTVTALKHEATTKLPRLPRMADFATWVEAASPAFGWEPFAFLSAYDGKRRSATLDLLSADLVAEALSEMTTPWEGPPTRLFRDLSTQDRRHAKDWPQTAQALSARLKRLAAPMRETGLEITSSRSRLGRVIRIARIGQADAADLPYTDL